MKLLRAAVPVRGRLGAEMARVPVAVPPAPMLEDGKAKAKSHARRRSSWSELFADVANVKSQDGDGK